MITKTLRVLAATSMLSLSATAAYGAQLITNGGFENPSNPAAGWVYTAPVSIAPISAYSPWTSGTYPYQQNAAFFGGGDSTLLGSLYQDINTLTGGSYTLSFAYGAIVAPNLQQLAVSVLNGVNEIVRLEVAAYGTQNVGAMMLPSSVTFTALSPTTRIRFTDMSASSASTDGVLDNVSVLGPVAAVPEPSTYALMLAGLGMMGFIARRRMNRG